MTHSTVVILDFLWMLLGGSSFGAEWNGLYYKKEACNIFWPMILC